MNLYDERNLLGEVILLKELASPAMLVMTLSVDSLF